MHGYARKRSLEVQNTPGDVANLRPLSVHKRMKQSLDIFIKSVKKDPYRLVMLYPVHTCVWAHKLFHQFGRRSTAVNLVLLKVQFVVLSSQMKSWIARGIYSCYTGRLIFYCIKRIKGFCSHFFPANINRFFYTFLHLFFFSFLFLQI